LFFERKKKSRWCKRLLLREFQRSRSETHAYRKSDLGNKRGRTRRRPATTYNSAIAVVTIVITGAAINHKARKSRRAPKTPWRSRRSRQSRGRPHVEIRAVPVRVRETLISYVATRKIDISLASLSSAGVLSSSRHSRREKKSRLAPRRPPFPCRVRALANRARRRHPRDQNRSLDRRWIYGRSTRL